MVGKSTRIAALALVCVIALALGCLVPCGAYSAKEIIKIHQRSYATATDLHVKVWQKEDYIHITDWGVGAVTGGGIGQPVATPGNQPEPYHSTIDPPGHPGSVPDDGTHAIDLNWNNISVPYCTWITIPFKWKLTEQNMKWVDVAWTKAADPEKPRKKAAAKNGWQVSPPVSGGGGGGGQTWVHHVTIANMDVPNHPLEPEPMDLYLRNIAFGTLEGLAPIDDDTLANWTDWTPAPVTSIVLHPGESLEYDVVTPWRDGHILTRYEVYDPTAGSSAGGAYTQEASDGILWETGDHPTPEPSSLLALGAGFLGLLGYRVRRRR